MDGWVRSRRTSMDIIIIIASAIAVYAIARPFLGWYEEAKQEGVLEGYAPDKES